MVTSATLSSFRHWHFSAFLVEILSAKYVSRWQLNYFLQLVSEFRSQKQLALPNITSREQLKYPYQAVPVLHDGKLDLDILCNFCQMILLDVELSIYQIQMPDL
jgi:hypothetical protein